MVVEWNIGVDGYLFGIVKVEFDDDIGFVGMLFDMCLLVSFGCLGGCYGVFIGLWVMGIRLVVIWVFVCRNVLFFLVSLVVVCR